MSFSRATSALIRADSLIAMIWFNVTAKRAALLALPFWRRSLPSLC